jgi:hypothetical protein
MMAALQILQISIASFPGCNYSYTRKFKVRKGEGEPAGE